MSKEKTRRRTRRDFLLFAAVLLAVTVGIVAVAPLVMSAHYLSQYKKYEMDLVDETEHARKTGAFSATLRGEPVQLTMQQIDAVELLLIREGPGIRDRKEPEEEGLTIRLGDAQLILSPVKLHGSGLKRENGVQVRYVYASGKTFCYDTDAFGFDHILRMNGLQ